uniref:Secreted protein n=2 Tax=Picea TaxID=3328 RepID=A0A101M031_PICGL|nr:hypothetical protein ABT39_MTgene5373 [Picea glauca]QHR90234.1 hypothetical protein Q903MT_gene4257 [Picea sitchensis]
MLKRRISAAFLLFLYLSWHRLNHFKGYTFLGLGGILARAKEIKKKRISQGLIDRSLSFQKLFWKIHSGRLINR